MLQSLRLLPALAKDCYIVESLRQHNSIVRKSNFASVDGWVQLTSRLNFTARGDQLSDSMIIGANSLLSRNFYKDFDWWKLIETRYAKSSAYQLAHGNSKSESNVNPIYFIVTGAFFLIISLFVHIFAVLPNTGVHSKIFLKSNLRFSLICSLALRFFLSAKFKKYSLLRKKAFVVGGFDIFSHAITFYYRSNEHEISEVQHGIFSYKSYVKDCKIKGAGKTLASHRFCWNETEASKSLNIFPNIIHEVTGTPLQDVKNHFNNFNHLRRCKKNFVLVALQPSYAVNYEKLNKFLEANIPIESKVKVRCHPLEILTRKQIIEFLPVFAVGQFKISDAEYVIEDILRSSCVISAWSSVNIEAMAFGISAKWSQSEKFTDYLNTEE